jgi:hypothetical protein
MRTNNTSVDFYVGTAPYAFWIGTMDSTEAEPPCMLENTEFGSDVLNATDIVIYRNTVSSLFNEISEESTGRAYTRNDGWPWSESRRSRADWVIQFHHGRAWITVGYPITPAHHADAAGPVATTDHAAARAPHSTRTGSSDRDHQADQRGMLFALLRDAVDAVTEGDYPGSGLEEAIDDLRDVFDEYSALADHARPQANAHTTYWTRQPR